MGFGSFFGLIEAMVIPPRSFAERRVGFKIPEFGLSSITWNDIITGTLLFTLPQIPLTLL